MAEFVLPIAIVIIGFLSSSAIAFVPIPLQDFCVADVKSTVKINGLPCKDFSTVTSNDFFSPAGLHLPQNTSNPTRAGIATVTVRQIPGLNAQGILIGRADLAPNGYSPPHYHPKAAEIVVVMEGNGLLMGFVSSYPNFVNFNKTLNKGDVFVVPQGLIHYLYNPMKETISVFFAQNSQDVGYIPVTSGIFGAKPGIDVDFLSKAYQLDVQIIRDLQSKF